jgi:hypothetical protein
MDVDSIRHPGIDPASMPIRPSSPRDRPELNALPGAAVLNIDYADV